MWFFMNVCYFMSFLTLIFFLLSFFQAIFHFHIFNANHVTFMVLTSIVYFFTETLVIFFFVGTGVSIKEYVKEHSLSAQFHDRSISIKRRLYPPLLLNILFMIILFVMVGAVDTYRITKWVYYLTYMICLTHLYFVKLNEHKCFRDNTKIILEMSGIKPQFS